MRASVSSRLLATSEWLLFALGVACLTWYGTTLFEIHRLQAEARVSIERMQVARKYNLDTSQVLPPSAGEIIGRLDIPRINLSAVVVDGDDDGVLDFAVGYLPDTPLPWRPGNSALAAHRDRLFRRLERIRLGDDISLATAHGDFYYQVRRTLVVNREDVWVLGPMSQVNLTLITCYPFSYIGHAPQRFIVQAEKIEQRSH